jgi:hypothetical protein
VLIVGFFLAAGMVAAGTLTRRQVTSAAVATDDQRGRDPAADGR